MENLSPKYLEIIDEIVKRHSDRPGPVKLMLHDIQHDLGYIQMEATMKVEDFFNNLHKEIKEKTL